MAVPVDVTPSHPTGAASLSVSAAPLSSEGLEQLGRLYVSLRPCTLRPVLMALEAGVIDHQEAKRCVDLWLLGYDFNQSPEMDDWTTRWRQKHGNQNPPWRADG